MSQGVRGTDRGSARPAGPSLTTYPDLDLDKRLGASVWRARADGVHVAARLATAAVFDPESPNPAAAHARAAALAAVV
jgi:hypothetical protein